MRRTQVVKVGLGKRCLGVSVKHQAMSIQATEEDPQVPPKLAHQPGRFGGETVLMLSRISWRDRTGDKDIRMCECCQRFLESHLPEATADVPIWAVLQVG